MSFKPKNATAPTGSGNYSQTNFPVPRAGARKARISMIVDLGEQNRPDIWKKGGEIVNEGTDGAECFPQKPVQQLAVFADLVADTVDYGGEIGKAHYRLMLNGSYSGVLKGINFSASPPKDAKGNTIEGKPWGFHPQNLLSKLAKAVGKPEVIESMDVTELLGEQFIAEVEVSEKASGKKDKDGNEIVYKNVNFKGASKVAPVETGEEDEDGNPIEEIPDFPALKLPAKCVTFQNATKDDIKFLRQNIIKQIKLANDYAGSQMQKAIEAFEAEQAAKGGNKGDDSGDADETPAEKPKAVKKPAAQKKPVPQDDMDDDAPF
jgi:hypothetical protein